MNPQRVTWTDLRTSARRLGALVWTEERLVSLAGERVSSAAEPTVAVTLARLARRHAARAGVVRDRLPELREVPAAEVVGPPSAAWEAVMEGLAGADEPVAFLAGLAGVVLPRLAASYRSVAAAASPVAEPTVRRRLPALADDVDDELRTLVPVVSDGTGPDGDLTALAEQADAVGGLLGP